MTGIQEYIARKKYSHGYSSQRKSYSIPSIDESSQIEKNLIDVFYRSSYNELKTMMKKDFEKRVESVHEKYESQIIDVLLKAINEIDCEVLNLNKKLSNTINSITKTK